jgi:hypothetical protein
MAASREKGYEKNAWILIFIAALLIIISGIGLWPSLQSPWPASYPAAAVTDLNLSQEELGLSWIFWGILVAAVAWTSYRKGERWSWYALWSLPAASVLIGLLVAGSFDIPITAFLTVPGLLLPIRKFFPKPAVAPI